ncbi:MAG: hypothetical protein B7Z41_04115 [Rhizobiales bacterium 12-66-7]|nr:MAG: hypothetical protein B7Z41_04115 [Rhizobiales bacterium 12-66-7]
MLQRDQISLSVGHTAFLIDERQQLFMGQIFDFQSTHCRLRAALRAICSSNSPDTISPARFDSRMHLRTADATDEPPILDQLKDLVSQFDLRIQCDAAEINALIGHVCLHR